MRTVFMDSKRLRIVVCFVSFSIVIFLGYWWLGGRGTNAHASIVDFDNLDGLQQHKYRFLAKPIVQIIGPEAVSKSTQSTFFTTPIRLQPPRSTAWINDSQLYHAHIPTNASGNMQLCVQNKCLVASEQARTAASEGVSWQSELGPLSARRLWSKTLLPEEQKYLRFPDLSNGALGTVAQSARLYLMGVYSGVGSESRRADIPVNIAHRVRHVDGLERDAPAGQHKLHLDLADGIFTETLVHRDLIVETRHTAHRAFPALLVLEVEVWLRRSTRRALQLVLEAPHDHSAGIDLTTRLVRDEPNLIQKRGRCASSEDEREAHGCTVHFVWTPVPDELNVPQSSSGRLRWTFLQASGTDERSVIAQFEAGLTLARRGLLLAAHRLAWKDMWQQGHVLIDAPTQVNLMAALLASQFYLLSAIPWHPEASEWPKLPGSRNDLELFPGDEGLARGNPAESKYSRRRGRVTWRQELWVAPALLWFHPFAVRGLLQYRVNRITAAILLGNKAGFEGAKFPLHSASSGIELADAAKVPDSAHKQHVSADISLLAARYLLATNDTWWAKQHGRELFLSIANYWSHRVEPIPGESHLLRLKPLRPAGRVSVFVTGAASLALEMPSRVWKFLGYGKRDYQFNAFDGRGKKLLLTRVGADPQHHEYLPGMSAADSVSNGVDPVFLGWPLDIDRSRDLRRADALFYGKALNQVNVQQNSMQLAAHAVAWLELGDIERAWSLTRQQVLHQRIPFRLWSSRPEGGQVNLLAGAAGFLQTFVAGYMGIRFRHDALVFLFPSLPPPCEVLRLRNLQYLGNRLDVEVSRHQVRLRVVKVCSVCVSSVAQLQVYQVGDVKNSALLHVNEWQYIPLGIEFVVRRVGEQSQAAGVSLTGTLLETALILRREIQNVKHVHTEAPGRPAPLNFASSKPLGSDIDLDKIDRLALIPVTKPPSRRKPPKPTKSLDSRHDDVVIGELIKNVSKKSNL